MAVLHLLCFTSLLTLAASDNYGLKDALAKSYSKTKSIDVLKEEIAKKITLNRGLYAIVHVTKFREGKLTTIICKVYNIKLTHRETGNPSEPLNEPSTVSKERRFWTRKSHPLTRKLMTYDLEMGARVETVGLEGESEEYSLTFEDSNVVLTVTSAKKIGPCFVVINDVKFNYGSPKGVTQDVWSYHMTLMGSSLDDEMKASMQNTLGNEGWICGTIPIKPQVQR